MASELPKPFTADPDEIQLLQIGAQRVVAGRIDSVEAFADILADRIARGVDAVAVGARAAEHDVIARAALKDIVPALAAQYVVADVALRAGYSARCRPSRWPARCREPLTAEPVRLRPSRLAPSV